MSFHRKVLIGYCLFNAVAIPLFLLGIDPMDRATATDQDLVIEGVVWPVVVVLTLLLSTLAVGAIYGVRGILRVGRMLLRRFGKG